jgi:hypothetical protein
MSDTPESAAGVSSPSTTLLADPSVIAVIRVPVRALTLVAWGPILDKLAEMHGGTGMLHQSGEWLVITANATLQGSPEA